MQVIDMATMKEAIKQIVIRKNRPCIFIGPSGCGKTEGADQVGIEEDIFLARFLLGQYDSVDMKGTPWVRTRDGYQDTVWHPASTLPFEGNPAFPDDRIILLHFDEATSGTVPVLGIMYQLTQERRVGEHKLKDNVRIMLSGNRESDKGIVNRFPMPLCNRLTWYELQPSRRSAFMPKRSVSILCAWRSSTGKRPSSIRSIPSRPTKCSRRHVHGSRRWSIIATLKCRPR